MHRASRLAASLAGVLVIFSQTPSLAVDKSAGPARDGGASAATSGADTTAPSSVVKGKESGPRSPKGDPGAHSAAETKAERRKQEEQGKANMGPKGEPGAHNVASSRAQEMKAAPLKSMPEPKSPKL